MALLEPKVAILDETDSGLTDALKIVANGVNQLASPENATILITHYQRLPISCRTLFWCEHGRIISSGGNNLALN